MQCEKSQRRRIIFELAEADVCQYIGRLQPVMRLVNARVFVRGSGRTLVGTSWIKQLDVEVIKLHPGLSRNIEKRSENQLLVQSLVEACKGMPVRFCNRRAQPQRVAGAVSMRCHGWSGGIFCRLTAT
jgi:RNase E specificity factor CsrD